MAIKIVIADDERPARSELIHQLQELIANVEIQEADSGAGVLNLVADQSFDLLFLDINLGDIQGTMLIKALKSMRPDMRIIFVTAYSEYAAEAFELEVEDYIMKPFSQKRLKRVLDKWLPKEEKEETASMERVVKNSLSVVREKQFLKILRISSILRRVTVDARSIR